jgi:hypothetical protein
MILIYLVQVSSCLFIRKDNHLKMTTRILLLTVCWQSLSLKSIVRRAVALSSRALAHRLGNVNDARRAKPPPPPTVRPSRRHGSMLHVHILKPFLFARQFLKTNPQ